MENKTHLRIFSNNIASVFTRVSNPSFSNKTFIVKDLPKSIIENTFHTDTKFPITILWHNNKIQPIDGAKDKRVDVFVKNEGAGTEPVVFSGILVNEFVYEPVLKEDSSNNIVVIKHLSIDAVRIHEGADTIRLFNTRSVSLSTDFSEPINRIDYGYLARAVSWNLWYHVDISKPKKSKINVSLKNDTNVDFRDVSRIEILHSAANVNSTTRISPHRRFMKQSSRSVEEAEIIPQNSSLEIPAFQLLVPSGKTILLKANATLTLTAPEIADLSEIVNQMLMVYNAGSNVMYMLRVTNNNPSKKTLPAGQVNVYNGSLFLGATHLKATAHNKTRNLSIASAPEMRIIRVFVDGKSRPDVDAPNTRTIAEDRVKLTFTNMFDEEKPVEIWEKRLRGENWSIIGTKIRGDQKEIKWKVLQQEDEADPFETRFITINMNKGVTIIDYKIRTIRNI